MASWRRVLKKASAAKSKQRTRFSTARDHGSVGNGLQRFRGGPSLQEGQARVPLAAALRKRSRPGVSNLTAVRTLCDTGRLLPPGCAKLSCHLCGGGCS
jgi:hypothetical protein